MTDKLRIISGDNIISFGSFDFDGEMIISIHNENTGEGKTSWLGIKEAKDILRHLMVELEEFHSTPDNN